MPSPRVSINPEVAVPASNKHEAVMTISVIELPKIRLNQCLPDLLKYEVEKPNVNSEVRSPTMNDYMIIYSPGC